MIADFALGIIKLQRVILRHTKIHHTTGTGFFFCNTVDNPLATYSYLCEYSQCLSKLISVWTNTIGFRFSVHFAQTNYNVSSRSESTKHNFLGSSNDFITKARSVFSPHDTVHTHWVTADPHSHLAHSCTLSRSIITSPLMHRQGQVTHAHIT